MNFTESIIQTALYTLLYSVALSLPLSGFSTSRLQLSGQSSPDSSIAQLQDGPYVFYQNGEITMFSVRDHVADSITWSITEKTKTKITVFPAGLRNRSFSLHLRDSLRPEPSVYPAPEKLFVLSDIEGEFDVFKALLVKSRIMNKRYHWTFGSGHLVICGDLFDRGKNVVPYLWLLYKLEDEAKQKGGYVHTILGNHDIMNLSGDYRYVDPKYFESAKMLGREYKQLFAADTELGRWLRTKNIIEKIGDRLFLHGGISPAVNASGRPVEDINQSCRPWYDGNRKNIPEELQVFFGREGLFWYRGYFLDPRASMNTVDSTLSIYNCKQVIVGHTIINKNIAAYYGGKVIGLDVNAHEGQGAALLISGDKLYTTDKKGKRNLLQYRPENDRIDEKDIL